MTLNFQLNIIVSKFMSSQRNLSAHKKNAPASSSNTNQDYNSSQNYSNPYLLAKPRSYAAAFSRPGSGNSSHRASSKDFRLGIALKASHDFALKENDHQSQSPKQGVNMKNEKDEMPSMTPKATPLNLEDESASHLRDTMPRQQAPPEPHRQDSELKDREPSKEFSPIRNSNSSLSVLEPPINKSFQSVSHDLMHTSLKKPYENRQTTSFNHQNYTSNMSLRGSQNDVVGVYETPMQGRQANDMGSVNMPTVSSAMRSLEPRIRAGENGRMSSRTQLQMPERSQSRKRLAAPNQRASNNAVRNTSSPRRQQHRSGASTSMSVRRPESAHGKQKPARVTSNTAVRTRQHISSYSTLQSNKDNKSKNNRIFERGTGTGTKQNLNINVKSRTANSDRDTLERQQYESRQESEQAPVEHLQRFIKVSARVRPLLTDEMNKPKILQVLQKNGDNSYQMPKPTTPMKQRVICLRTKSHFNNGHRFYNFENTLDEACSQADVFQHTQITEMCQLFVRKGMNCNVLVYGPTNSGKTHTMIGNGAVYQSLASNVDKLNSSFHSGNGGGYNRKSRSPLKRQDSRKSHNGIGIYQRGSSKARLDTSEHKPLGQSESDGILPRALRTILHEYINFQVGFIQNNFELRFSAVEIYNDQLTDLLSDFNSEDTQSEYQGRPRSLKHVRSGTNISAQEDSIHHRQNLDIRELIQNGQKQLIVSNLSEIPMNQTEQAQSLLKHALYRRQVHETTKNLQSSRSHAIFMVKLYTREDSGQTSQATFKSNFFGYLGGSKYSQQNIDLQNQLASQSNLVSQFIFVDLAGSEKLDGEKDPQRILEAKHINKSLSALGNVIQALKTRPLNFSYPSNGDAMSATASSLANKRTGSSNSPMKHQPVAAGHHIPYRDSKLTHLLKPCFNNGNSLTHLIICFGPTQANLQECISSMKFAQNAKSIKQNQEEAQMQQKAVRLVGDGFNNNQQHRGFAPEKLWQLLQASQDIEASASMNTPGSQNLSLSKQAESEVFQGINEIEKLLNAASFEEDANNARLHKALVLALAQLRQFKLSEKELNDKVQHLETMLAEKSQRIGSGHRQNDSSGTSFLENTSKFGTGTIQMNVETPDLDGRVEPNISKDNRAKAKLEGSLNHPLQSSSNSGTAFLDLMLINSSKLEPTDSQNTSLMIPDASRQGINPVEKEKLQWSMQAQLISNAGGAGNSSHQRQKQLNKTAAEARQLNDKDFTMKYLQNDEAAQSPDRPMIEVNLTQQHLHSTTKQPRHLDSSGFVVTEEETVMVARDSAVQKNNLSQPKPKDLDFSSPTNKSVQHDYENGQVYQSVKDYMSGAAKISKHRTPIGDNSSSVHTHAMNMSGYLPNEVHQEPPQVIMSQQSSSLLMNAAPGQMNQLVVHAETMSDKSIDSQEELIVNNVDHQPKRNEQGKAPPLLLDHMNLAESENITIETQRHLLPPGSELGHGNNQSANTIVNFTYAGSGKLASDSNRNDQISAGGIRSATGTSSSFKLKQALAQRGPASMNASQSLQQNVTAFNAAYPPGPGNNNSSQQLNMQQLQQAGYHTKQLSTMSKKTDASGRSLSQMRSVFSSMRQASQPKQQYQYATNQTQSNNQTTQIVSPTMGGITQAQRPSLGGAQTVQTPLTNLNRLPSRMSAQSPLTYMEPSQEPRSPQTEFATNTSNQQTSAFQTTTKNAAGNSQKKAPASYRTTSVLSGVKQPSTVTSARRPILAEKRGKSPQGGGVPKPSTAAGTQKRLAATSKALLGEGRSTTSRQGLSGRVQVAAPATAGTQRNRANQKSPTGVKSTKSKK